MQNGLRSHETSCCLMLIFRKYRLPQLVLTFLVVQAHYRSMAEARSESKGSSNTEFTEILLATCKFFLSHAT